MEFPEDMKKNPNQWCSGLRISYIGIALAVAVGVVAGQLTIKVGEHYWLLYQLKIAAQELEATTSKMNAKARANREERLKTQAEAAKIREKQEYDRKNALRTNTEICNFWIKEFKAESSSYNKRMMEDACTRARNYK